MLAIGASAAISALAAAVPAFPGAEGFGSDTTHARGKPVFHVTRLDDEDKWQSVRYLKEGQFRWALARAAEADGGYIVFDVTGAIQLKRTAQIPSNVYVAGQTAPGKGIAIEGAAIVIGGKQSAVKNVVIRHVRFRGKGPRGSDAFNIEGPGTEKIVLDHVSISFFRDGAVDIVNGARDVTVQWCHMGDAVFSGTNEKYHCEPNLLRTNVNCVSLHHNYYTHCHSRAPQVQNTCAEEGFLIEFSNNVIYDYRKYPSNFEARNGKGNVVGNYYIPGRFTHGDRGLGTHRGTVTGGNNFTVHVRDNRSVDGVGHDDVGCPGSDQDTCRGNDQWVTGARPDDSRPETDIMGKVGAIGPTAGVLNYSPTRFDEIPEITYIAVEKNIDEVISKFGALPRDNTDRRLVKELLTRTGGWKLEMPEDNNIYGGEPRADNDRDGMADDWEAKHGGNLEPGGHDLHRVYDNLEVHLNELAETLARQAEPIAAHKAVLNAGHALKRP
jgi:hypothetical protein